jgi:hypothetical protein
MPDLRTTSGSRQAHLIAENRPGSPARGLEAVLQRSGRAVRGPPAGQLRAKGANRDQVPVQNAPCARSEAPGDVSRG